MGITMSVQKRQRDFLILTIAAVACPVVAAAFLGVSAAHADDPWLRVVLPALSGVTLALVPMRKVFAATGAGAASSVQSREARSVGRIAFALILAVALLGNLGDTVPIELRAFFDGLVIGFFVPFVMILRRLSESFAR
jgi:RsiW-degrading membrane proteinase PrsW (M82 family)